MESSRPRTGHAVPAPAFAGLHPLPDQTPLREGPHPCTLGVWWAQDDAELGEVGHPGWTVGDGPPHRGPRQDGSYPVGSRVHQQRGPAQRRGPSRLWGAGDVPTSLLGREKVQEGVSSKESVLDQSTAVQAPRRAGCAVPVRPLSTHRSNEFTSGRHLLRAVRWWGRLGLGRSCGAAAMNPEVSAAGPLR